MSTTVVGWVLGVFLECSSTSKQGAHQVEPCPISERGLFMRRKLSLVMALALVTALLTSASGAGAAGDAGEVVVANRASGTISVIDIAQSGLVTTVALPAGDNDPEPMYVTSSRSGDRVFVGDRANNRVVVFDGSDWSVEATVPTGAGVFHMWADPRDRQLWVNNDLDATATVIDPISLDVIATVPMPADLVAAGYVPHDVVLSLNGRTAYITFVGGEGNDWVVQFDTRTFTERNRAAVGLDPHVSVTNRALYVPAQNSDVVHVLDLRTLDTIAELEVPGAHGAGMSPNRRGPIHHKSSGWRYRRLVGHRHQDQPGARFG